MSSRLINFHATSSAEARMAPTVAMCVLFHVLLSTTTVTGIWITVSEASHDSKRVYEAPKWLQNPTSHPFPNSLSLPLSLYFSVCLPLFEPLSPSLCFCSSVCLSFLLSLWCFCIIVTQDKAVSHFSFRLVGVAARMKWVVNPSLINSKYWILGLVESTLVILWGNSPIWSTYWIEVACEFYFETKAPIVQIFPFPDYLWKIGTFSMVSNDMMHMHRGIATFATNGS